MARKKITDKIHAADEDTEQQINTQSHKVVELEYLGAQIPKELGNRLRRAALNHKENRERPWLIKEITVEAFGEWLDKRGF